MNILDTQEKRTIERQDQIGSLADSARRHLAYEALSEQVTLSEAALRRILEAIGERTPQIAQRPLSTDGE